MAGGRRAGSWRWRRCRRSRRRERVDLDAIYKIKDEGFQRSQVMEIMSWLTDVYGPRLTNSPGFRKAGDWAVKEMTSWGLANVKLEPFGPFGRGWSNDKFYMMATTPGGSFPVIGMSDRRGRPAPTASVSGDAVLAVHRDRRGPRASSRASCKGKFVLDRGDARRAGAVDAAGAAATPTRSSRTLERETDATAAAAGGGRAGGPGRQGGRRRGAAARNFAQRARSSSRTKACSRIVDAGPRRRRHGVRPGRRARQSREPNADLGLPAVVIAVEHYGRIVRTLEKNMPVTIELDIKNTFHDDTDVVQRRRARFPAPTRPTRS